MDAPCITLDPSSKSPAYHGGTPYMATMDASPSLLLTMAPSFPTGLFSFRVMHEDGKVFY